MTLLLIQRSCGECSVCCDYVSIDELQKPARTPCRHLSPAGYGCAIYESSSRPKVCHDFQCAWRRGVGREEDRPDRIGAMVSINQIEDGLFALALEIQHGAILGSAGKMISQVARTTLLPVIVSDYESLPPNDKGDRVAAHHSILYRARRMLGPLIDWVSPDVALHTLVKENHV